MKTKSQQIQRSLAMKATRAKEIATIVDNWNSGKQTMDMRSASQQITLLCEYVTELDFLVKELNMSDD